MYIKGPSWIAGGFTYTQPFSIPYMLSMVSGILVLTQLGPGRAKSPHSYVDGFESFLRDDSIRLAIAIGLSMPLIGMSLKCRFIVANLHSIRHAERKVSY